MRLRRPEHRSESRLDLRPLRSGCRWGHYAWCDMSQTGSTRNIGNLAAELTSFVGRRREVTEVSRSLSSSRLVTLTGVGGVGKTRLALRVGNDRRRDFLDGVWFVDLAPLEDEGLLTQTIASALGLQDQRAAWPVSALANSLRDKKLLLILDNCEHVRDSCAIVVDALLRSGPELRVLATSRQSLGLTGEQVFLVPPLTFPESMADVGAESMVQYEAINLFVERARAVRPSFEVTEDNLRALGAVCRRLDGIPLALELAAARMSALSVHDLLARLEDRFNLLTGGSAAALPRHQTLRELIAWSWELCSDEERKFWARASVFPSEFDLPAAEAICAGRGLDIHSILDVLTGLVEKTILMVHEQNGSVRYRMLETLRQYGRVKLEGADDECDVRQAHRLHYRRLATAARVAWFGERQKHWLDWFRLEHSNLRVALDASFDQPDLIDSGLEIIADLWVFWFATGRTSEARHWLERGLRSPSVSKGARAGALARNAYLSVIQQDLGSAKSIINELEALGPVDGEYADPEWSMTYVTALVSMSQGELARADSLLEDALVAVGSASDVQWLQEIAFCRAIVKALLGKLVDAEEICLESIRTSDQHGESSVKSYMLWCLGFTLFQGDRPSEAAAHARNALSIAHELEDEPFVVASCFELLAWIDAAGGGYEAAARLLGAAGTIWSRTGSFLLTVRQLTQHHDHCVSTVRSKLGDDRLAEAMTLGAGTPWEQSIAEALGESRMGSTLTTPRDGTLGALTKRESEVASLVSEGLTNKEIAGRLVIAQRTAEAHVERILSKLDFTSRAQVAAWVVEQRGPHRFTRR